MIAQHPSGFTLFERCPGSNGWSNFKLVNSQRRKKRNWWLGWNGERLARSNDTKLLREHEPAIADWLIGVLKERFPASPKQEAA